MSTEATVPRVEPVTPLSGTSGRSSSVLGKIPLSSGVRPVIFSFTDQALAVAGSFLANLVLARTQSKDEYGMFALSYSVLTFLSGLHNSLVLEPGTVYASGRYQNHFRQYLGLVLRINAFVGLILTILVLLSCLVVRTFVPQLVSSALVGMGLSVGVLLSGAFLRRVFYLQRQPRFAAQASLICFTTIASGLFVANKAHVLNGCSGFLILALGWIIGGIGTRKHLQFGDAQAFLDSEPNYWREHWKYSKWVLATAVVFQLAVQGYYWLVAALLSVKEVGELRAMYLLVSPIDQAFIALSLLLIPVLASYYAVNRMANFFSVCKRFALGIAGMTVLVAIVIRTFGKPLIHAIYAGRFDAVAPILYLLALLPILTGMATVLSGAINSSERPKLVFYAYAASGATTFAAGIPLVIRFGLRGAAYGMLLSSAMCTAVLLAGFLVIIGPKLKVTDGQRHLNYERPPSSYLPAGNSGGSSVVGVKPPLAPIAFFVYCRPEHTLQSLEALRNNELARDTELFVFSDGPKNYAVAQAVQTIRNSIRSIEGFRSVTLVERERNFGLSHSIIDGVTTLCNEYGRVIVVEDDIVTSADFLTFMNSALDRYANHANVFSVSGFRLPIQIPQSYAYDAFYSYRFMCWGWGTWKDRWQTADWSVGDYAEFCRDRERQKRFNRGGNDLSWLLGRHIIGRIDSWDTVWAYTHSRNDALAVLSVKPRAYNIGFDGSGVHCRRVPFRQTALAAGTSSGYVFPDDVAPDPHLAAAIRRLHHRSLPRQFIRYVYDRLGIS